MVEAKLRLAYVMLRNLRQVVFASYIPSSEPLAFGDLLDMYCTNADV